MDQVISATGLRKQYFRKGRDQARYFDAVADVDIELRAGELVEVVGRSGSGKSTLLNMLAGLLAPTEGEVLLDGRDLYALSDDELSRLRNERIGVVPQGQTALHNLTVADNVKLPYLMYRDRGDIDVRAIELLDEVGIGHLSEVLPSELSGGELRRMAIARALACKPKVLLADEPTGDLDDENTKVVFELLRRIADEGCAVLLVTHESSAAGYADRILRMDAGRFVD